MSALAGRVAVITGATMGLGRAIAEAYLREGASIALCGRDPAQVQRAGDALRTLAGAGQQVIAHVADVSQPDAVAHFLEAAHAAFPRIHILVNNAGVYGPIGPLETVDWDAWVHAVMVNLMGSVLLCRALVPHFKANSYGKIIQLSGGGATSPLPRLSAYAASKAAVVRFAETLAEELRDDHIDVNCIAPGALNTRLMDQILDAGPEQVGADFYARTLRQQREGSTPLSTGAALAVYLATQQSDGLTGKLISAVWDDWEHLAEHASEMDRSDIYTLRRIVPADRGVDWSKT